MTGVQSPTILSGPRGGACSGPGQKDASTELPPGLPFNLRALGPDITYSHATATGSVTRHPGHSPASAGPANGGRDPTGADANGETWSHHTGGADGVLPIPPQSTVFSGTSSSHVYDHEFRRRPWLDDLVAGGTPQATAASRHPDLRATGTHVDDATDGPAAATSSVILLHAFSSTGQKARALILQGEGTLDLSNQAKRRTIYPTAPVRDDPHAPGVRNCIWYDIKEPHLHTTRGRDADDDMASISTACREVDRLIRVEVERGVPAEKVFVGGFADGGSLAVHAAARSRFAIGGCFLFTGFLPKRSPTFEMLKKSKNPNLRVFLTAATADGVSSSGAGSTSCGARHEVPWQWIDATAVQLERNGCHIQFHQLDQTDRPTVLTSAVGRFQKWVDARCGAADDAAELASREAAEQAAAAARIQKAAAAGTFERKKKKASAEVVRKSFLKQAGAIFDDIDADKNGNIDAAELQAGMRSNKQLMRMMRQADSSSSSFLALDGLELGRVSREHFEAFVTQLSTQVVKKQECERRRRDGIVSQAEKMFREVDADGSNSVDEEELAAAVGNAAGGFARLIRQLGRPLKVSDVSSSGCISLKKFIAFVRAAMAEVERAREEMEFGGMFEESDAATKIQAVQRGKQARKEKREQDKAAAKIQAASRRKKARKEAASKSHGIGMVGDSVRSHDKQRKLEGFADYD